MAEFQKFPEQKPERTISAHKGTDSRNVPWLIDQSAGAHLENLSIEDPGARTRRRAAASFGGVHIGINSPGGLGGYRDAFFDEFLVGVFGSEIQRSNGNAAWNQIASTASMIDGVLHQFVTGIHLGENALAVCTCDGLTDPTSLGINGRSQLVIYSVNSDLSTQVSLAPRTIAVFQNRLFYAENELIGWSEIGDWATNDPGGNSVLVDPGNGGPITAIVPSRDLDPKLWIFKEDAIHLFTLRWGAAGDNVRIPAAGDALDTTNSSIVPLSLAAGCIATKSFQWVPEAEEGDGFFLARDGIRSLRRAQNDAQAGAGLPISNVIPEWVARINFTHAHKATSAMFDNAYHLAVPLDGAIDNTHVLRYDVENKAWSLHTYEARDISGLRLGAASRLFMQNNFPTIDSSTTDADTSDSPPQQVYQLFTGTFDPSTNAVLPVIPQALDISRSFIFGDLRTKKRWDRLTLDVSSADTAALSISVRRDQGDFSTITDTRIEGAAGTVVLAVDPLPWNGEADQLRMFSFPLNDVAPSRKLQVRLTGITGATEVGRLTTYMTEVTGHLLTDDFANDA